MNLSKKRFGATHVKRKWPFLLLGSDFAQFFLQIVSIRVKILNNTILVASKHVKRGKASLPIDMCHSKTPLLKLPITLVFNRDDYYDEVLDRRKSYMRIAG